MNQIRSVATTVCLSCVLLPAAGCMRGVMYKVPMPSSMTVGTMEAHDLAARRARDRQSPLWRGFAPQPEPRTTEKMAAAK